MKESDLAVGRIFPPLSEIRKVSLAIALRVAEFAYEANVAHQIPKPADLLGHIAGKVYQPEYVKSVSQVYDWPDEAIRNTSQDLYGK